MSDKLFGVSLDVAVFPKAENGFGIVDVLLLLGAGSDLLPVESSGLPKANVGPPIELCGIPLDATVGNEAPEVDDGDTEGAGVVVSFFSEVAGNCAEEPPKSDGRASCGAC